MYVDLRMWDYDGDGGRVYAALPARSSSAGNWTRHMRMAHLVWLIDWHILWKTKMTVGLVYFSIPNTKKNSGIESNKSYNNKILKFFDIIYDSSSRIRCKIVWICITEKKTCYFILII